MYQIIYNHLTQRFNIFNQSKKEFLKTSYKSQESAIIGASRIISEYLMREPIVVGNIVYAGDSNMPCLLDG